MSAHEVPGSTLTKARDPRPEDVFTPGTLCARCQMPLFSGQAVRFLGEDRWRHKGPDVECTLIARPAEPSEVYVWAVASLNTADPAAIHDAVTSYYQWWWMANRPDDNDVFDLPAGVDLHDPVPAWGLWGVWDVMLTPGRDDLWQRIADHVVADPSGEVVQWLHRLWPDLDLEESVRHVADATGEVVDWPEVEHTFTRTQHWAQWQAMRPGELDLPRPA